MASLLMIYKDRRVLRHELGTADLTFRWGDGGQLLPSGMKTEQPAFRLVRSSRGYSVRNLDVANPLLVKGQPVNEAELRHAEVIQCGTVIVIFRAADEEPAPGPLALDYPTRPPGFDRLRKITGFQNLTWFLTRLGRARHALIAAASSPDSKGRMEAVARALLAMLRGKRPQNPEFYKTLENLYGFMCWYTTTHGELAHAEGWLKAMVQDCPNPAQRMPLRWDLVKALWKVVDLSAFTRQAKALLADKAATADKWGGIAADLAGRSYVGGSAGGAREIILSANQGIQTLPQIKAMLAAIECPRSFASLEDATKWASRLQPDAIASCNVMRADAWLARAAAAEWQSDWTKMRECALEALCAAPSHRPASYWLTRAMLHFPTGNPAEHISGVWPDEKPEWKRLRLALELHQRPGVKAAEQMATVLSALQNKEDAPEITLAIALVERALRGKELIDPADLTAVARVCRAVQAKAGAMLWTTVHLARHDLLVERRYTDACRRLERKDYASDLGAADCLAVAQIMEGSKLAELAPNTSPGLQIIINAVERIHGEHRNVTIRQLAELRGGALVARFPVLQPVIDAIMLAIHALDGEIKAGDPALDPRRLHDDAEPWVRWLFVRTLFLIQRGEIDVQLGASLPVKYPYVAWTTELWAWNQRQSRTRTLEFASPGSAELDRWVAGSPRERRACAQLRQARLANYSAAAPQVDHTLPAEIFPELGDLWDKLSRADMNYEVDFCAARRELVEGDPWKAAQLFRKLDSIVSGRTGILEAWWRPLGKYWMGVAQARAGVEAAPLTFRSLLGGPRDPEARGQLALLELKGGRLDEAERWSAENVANHPSIRYARGLVFARRGELKLMQKELATPEARRILEGSSYDIPAQRLVAATQERLGHEEEAEHLRLQLLAARPHDEITVARQSRYKLRLQYQKMLVGRPDHEPAADALAIISTPIRRVAWRRNHALLRNILTANAEELASLRVASVDPNWLQILAHSLLRQGNAQAAFDSLAAIDTAAAPERTIRTRAVLFAWRLLSRSGLSHERDPNLPKALAECSERLEQVPKTDEVLAFWRQLLNKGRQIAAARDERPLGVWAGADSHASGMVAGLFAEEPEVRKQTAAALAAKLSRLNALTERQVFLLKALIAWENNEDDAYLESYAFLEPILDELPVSGVQLWVASALVHFARKDWRGVLDAELPDCVADLASDDVRFLVGILYARAAAEECVKGDIRNVLQNVRRAQDHLEELIEAGSSQG